MALSQPCHESAGRSCVESQAGRQLHQQAAEFFTEAIDLREDGLKKAFAVPQAVFVGEGFGQLDRKAEMRGHAGGPSCISGRLVRAVKRGVDLYRVKARCIALQVAAL